MEWLDQGIILKQRRHGEHDAIITALTQDHGKHLGLIKGGFSARKRAYIETGQEAKLRWVARLADQLGRFDLEPMRPLSAPFFDDSSRLKAILSVAGLLDAALPEREKHTDLYQDLLAFFLLLHQQNWLTHYVRWEAHFLAGLGYGFDLSSCAVTGKNEELIYVSPRSGKAVSKEGAGEYVSRLLPLPAFLLDEEKEEVSLAEIKKGLKLTGYFLEHHVFHHQPVPSERRRMIESI